MSTNPHYTELQSALLRLQELELEGQKVSRAYQTHLGHDKREQLVGTGNKLLAEYSKLDATKKDFDKKITELEDELELLREKTKEEKEMLDKTSDARSAQALTRSVETHARRIDKIEHDLLGLMESREAEVIKMKEYEENVEKIKTAIGELDKGLKSLREQVDVRLIGISAERKTAVEKIPAEILERYRKIVTQNKGIGVEEYRRETNSGSVCSVKLSVTQTDEIAAFSGEVTTCPACRRLMVVAHA